MNSADVAGAETLRCQGVKVLFEGVQAVEDVDLELKRGAIMGLIGTNGAGKTTLVNVISGYQPSDAGRVLLGDREITGWPPARLARAGVVRTFQNGRVFPALTVVENVEVAGVGTGLGTGPARRRAYELLETAGLSDRRDVPASALTHGEVRVLSLARALATSPRFMLVDEPAAGSNETESERLLELLRWIAKEFEVGLLVIEHDMSLIMRLCHRIQVLDHGRTIALGDPAEVRKNPSVVAAYLGTEK